jgi:hypothetical protein
MNKIEREYAQPNGPEALDRMATAGGRNAGIGWLFKKPVDPVKSARAKAMQASRTPEERRESALTGR